MAPVSRLMPGFYQTKARSEHASNPMALGTISKADKAPAATSAEDANTADIFAEVQAKLPAQDAQRGVQDVEAVTLTWSKQSLVTVFIL
jgi:hypothetical protein